MTAHRICLVLAATACLLPLAGTRAQTPLGPEFRVNAYTTGDQRVARVAADRRGRFMVVWQSADQDGDGLGIFARRFDNRGEALGDPLQANAHTTGDQRWPAVAAAADGRFMVVWQSADGDNYDVFGRHFAADGSSAGDDLLINDYTTGNQRFPAVAAAPDGGFLVVWRGHGPSGTGVFSRLLNSAGIPSGATLEINTSASGSSGRQALTRATNHFVAVWDEGFGSTIHGRRLQADGSPFGTEFITSDYSPDFSEGKNTPDVAADGLGNFVVVWREIYYLAGTGSTAAQRFNATGSPLGGVFRVQGGVYLAPPRVSRNADDFVTVWAAEYFGGPIGGKRWASDGTLQTTFTVSPFASGLSTQQADVDHQQQSEDFIVVWSRQNDDDDYDVFARVYEIARFRDGFESGTTASWSASVGE